MTTSVLDKATTYTTLDPSGMRARLTTLGQQCRDAYRIGKELPMPARYRGARSLVLAGMGGSAIGGELLADLATFLRVSFPMVTWRDYGLPPWAGEEALVLVSSYSGETEETLSAFHDAVRRRASTVVLTSGGTLESLARTHTIPTIPVVYWGEPRTALGYSLVVPLAILEALGFFPPFGIEVARAADLVEALTEEYNEEVPEERNDAKRLARLLHGRLPVIYGAGLLAGAAHRWKADLHENAKTWAIAETLPELGHNVVTAYGLPATTRESATVIFLHSSLLPPRISLRYRLVAELLDQAEGGIPHVQIEARGENPLSHLLSLVYLGEWVSYYLGLLYRVDPSTVPGLDYLKKRLAEESDDRKDAAL